MFGYHMGEALRDEERGRGEKDRRERERERERERALQKPVDIPILCGIEVTHLFPRGGWERMAPESTLTGYKALPHWPPWRKASPGKK